MVYLQYIWVPRIRMRVYWDQKYNQVNMMKRLCTSR